MPKTKRPVIGPVMAERSRRKSVCAWCGRSNPVGVARDGAGESYWSCGQKGHGRA
jgi:hypothetical protein